MSTKPDDAELLRKINEAVTAANNAEQAIATAQAELVSRSKTVGLLLLEAKRLHPAVKDFEAFLAKVQGLKLSRAYDLMRLAGGRTTDEELRKDARERKQKSRKNKKLPRPAPAPKPEPVSVTVTESAEASAGKRKAESAERDPPLDEKAAKVSAKNLAEFIIAARMYLPKITVESDRAKARGIVSALTSGNPKTEAA